MNVNLNYREESESESEAAQEEAGNAYRGKYQWIKAVTELEAATVRPMGLVPCGSRRVKIAQPGTGRDRESSNLFSQSQEAL